MMSLDNAADVGESPETVWVKEEPKYQCAEDSSSLASTGLYEDHDIKDDLVLGPEQLQPQDIAYNNSQSSQVQFTRMDIFKIWHLAMGSPTEKYRLVLDKVLESIPNAENVEIGLLRKRIKYITKIIAKHWKKMGRTRRELVKKYEKWLSVLETIDIPNKIKVSASEDRLTDQKMKDFESYNKQTQQRRQSDLLEIDNWALINTSLTSSGPNDTLKREVNPSEVLSLIREAKLTKHQYLLMKDFINSRQSPVMPSYEKVLNAKNQCYPKINIKTEESATK